MSTTKVSRDNAGGMEGATNIDTKFEVAVIPVSDVRRGKADRDWPAWSAAFMVAEQAGTELPS